MKKEWADKWVAALRSGKYQQGIGALQRDSKFCCLGVLCDITNTPIVETSEFNVVRYGMLDSSSRSYLPSFTREKTGMKSGLGNSIKTSRSLLTLNDTGASFETIADVIEENWEQL